MTSADKGCICLNNLFPVSTGSISKNGNVLISLYVNNFACVFCLFFKVIGSDGLWETLHRQEVVRVVGEYLTGVHQRQPLKVGGYRVTLGQMQALLEERKARVSSAFEDQNSATHLMRHAVGNNEFGTVDHERLSKMLSLPEELARMYRDDITIIIAQFNPHVIGAQRQEGQSSAV